MADENIIIAAQIDQAPFVQLENNLASVAAGLRRLGDEVRSSAFQQGGKNILDGISGTLRQQFDDLELVTSRMERARIRMEEVLKKSQIPIGGSQTSTNAQGETVTDKGYVSANAQRSALLQAAEGETVAAKALARVEDRYRAVLEQETRAREAVLGVIQRNARSLFDTTVKGSVPTTGVAADESAIRRQISAALRKQEQADAAIAREEEKTAAALAHNLDQINQAHTRRIQAEDKVTREEEQNATRLASVHAEVASIKAAAPYPNAVTGTPVGDLQQGVNAATLGHELALRKLTAANNATTASTESILAAEKQEESSLKALSSAQRALATATGRSQGTLSSQFLTGFKGVSDRPYAEQIGQAFKFSVLYGSAYKILFGITQSLSFSLREGIDFQQSITDLSIASGRSATSMKTLSQNISQAATQSGLAPSQGIQIAARSLGLFGVAAGSGATLAQQSAVADVSTRTVARAAFTTGLNPEDLQRDLSAIAKAFGGGAQGQVRAADLDAYISKRLGSGLGSTYAAVAQSGVAGQAAGFDQAQITAIAAVLQARTGQDATTVAGYMAQLFSRSGQGTLVGIEQQYGVNSNQTLAAQVSDLRKVYQSTPSARDDISAVFGRGKSQDAFVALLQGLPDALKVAKESGDPRTGALGASNATFNLKLSNLGGQLAVFSGDLKAFASELGQSGLLNVLGVGIKVLDEFVKGVTASLQFLDQVPAAVRGLIGAFILAEEVYRNRALLQGLLPGAEARAAEGGLLSSYAAKDAGGVAGVGSKVASVAGIATAVTAVLAVSQLRSAEGSLNSAYQRGATDLSAGGITQNSTSDQLRARASALNDDASAANDAMHSFWGSIIQFADKNKSPAAADRAEAVRLTDLAARNDRLAAQSANTGAIPLISGFDSTSLASSMQAITDSGGNARDRLKALNDALNGTTSAAAAAAKQFDAKGFAGGAADPIYQALLKTGKATGKLVVPGILGTPLNRSTTDYNAIPVAVDKGLAVGANGRSPQQVLQDRLQAALKQQHVNSLADISPKVAGQLATSTVGTGTFFGLLGLGIDPKTIQKVQNQEINAVRQYLLGQAKSVRDIVRGNVKLSPSELTAAINQVTGDTGELLGLLQTSDHSGKISALKREISKIRTLIQHAPGGATSQAQDQIDAARRALSNEQISELEDLRRAAQRDATSKKQIASIGRGFLVREVNNAVRAQNQDKLVELVGIAGKYGKTIALNAIQHAIAIARAAISVESELQAFASSELAGIKGMIGQLAPSGPTNRNSPEVKRLQAIADALRNTASGNASTDVFASGSDSNNPLASAGASPAAATPGPTAAQINAARLTALAQGSQSQIQTARAAIATARADMANAKKGTVEYYSALGAYLSARNDLTAALQQYHDNLFLLTHDATDPVVQAQAQLRSAAAKLRADAHKPADVRAADKVAEQSAQASLESARFTARLDAAQTAEQLGRTSFRAYINYLDNEQARLKAISHRSYQQQQELNQVDQLLQSAASSMQGVFNFGSINLPKPYQVKRYIEDHFGTTSGGVGGGGASVANNTTIYIDGADTGKVLKVVKDHIGTNVRLQTTSPRRR